MGIPCLCAHAGRSSPRAGHLIFMSLSGAIGASKHDVAEEENEKVQLASRQLASKCVEDSEIVYFIGMNLAVICMNCCLLVTRP